MSDAQEERDATGFTKADIESRLRSVQALLQGRFRDEKQNIIGAAVGAGLIAVVMAYFAGKRKGRKQSAYVEIRRS